MDSVSTDDSAISALSPSHVAGYLRARGWEDNGQYGPYGQLYLRTRSDRTYQVVLPRSSAIGDYLPRMRALIELLAESEGRPWSTILFDLTLAPFDVIRVRTLDADAYGSVRFEHGLHLHEESKRVMAAAASAAASKEVRKAWKGRRPISVSQYLEHLRLGQTENASFSLTLLSPYSFDPSHQDNLFPEQAFGRRVTLKLASALEGVQAALADSLSDPIRAFESKLHTGISADMCSSLAKLADNDAGIQLSVSWSPVKPTGEPFCLRLSRHDASILQDVARALAKEVPEPEFVIEGLVEEIKNADNDDGSVVVQSRIPDQGLRRVRIRFSGEVRDLVFDAAKKKAMGQGDRQFDARG